jgi:hypothetical protein
VRVGCLGLRWIFRRSPEQVRIPIQGIGLLIALMGGALLLLVFMGWSRVVVVAERGCDEFSDSDAMRNPDSFAVKLEHLMEIAKEQPERTKAAVDRVLAKRAATLPPRAFLPALALAAPGDIYSVGSLAKPLITPTSGARRLQVLSNGTLFVLVEAPDTESLGRAETHVRALLARGAWNVATVRTVSPTVVSLRCSPR